MREVNAGNELVNKILELCDLPPLADGVCFATLTIDTDGKLTVHTEGLVLKPVEDDE